jgi:hypothetical protein
MKKIFFLLFLSISGLLKAQDLPMLSVIGNQAAVPAQLSMTDLQEVFMGKKAKWSGGEKVVIALMKFNTDAGKATCAKVYRMGTDEVKKYWLTLSMKGTTEAPVFFNTTDELKDFVAKTRGAVGIIEGTASSGSFRTVLIDGKKSF